MKGFRGLTSYLSTSRLRGANIFYAAMIIFSFSAASINSSPSPAQPPPSSPMLKLITNTTTTSSLSLYSTSSVPLKESSYSSPASSNHFTSSQVSISEATSKTPSVHYNSPDEWSAPIFTNQFVLEIKGGEPSAKEFAHKHGFIYLGQVSISIEYIIIIFSSSSSM